MLASAANKEKNNVKNVVLKFKKLKKTIRTIILVEIFHITYSAVCYF